MLQILFKDVYMLRSRANEIVIMNQEVVKDIFGREYTLMPDGKVHRVMDNKFVSQKVITTPYINRYFGVCC